MEVTIKKINEVQKKAWRRSEFLDSIAYQLQKGRNLTEKQVAAANKVMDAITENAEKQSEKAKKEMANSGVWDEARQMVEGKIVSIKTDTNVWEQVQRIVLVTDDGKKIRFNAPAMMYNDGVNDKGYADALLTKVGDRIEIELNVKPSAKRTDWASGTRATKYQMVTYA